MSRFVTCGAFNNGMGLCDILVDTVTGELILLDDIGGNSYISELTVMDPITPEEDANLQKVLDYFGADGVVMSQSYLVTLKDGVASYREFADNSKIVKEIQYDTDMVCEITDFTEGDEY